MEKRYVNVNDIANYLGMSKPSIYRYAESRKIPFLKIGKVLRFDVVEIEKWLREYKREAIT